MFSLRNRRFGRGYAGLFYVESQLFTAYGSSYHSIQNFTSDRGDGGAAVTSHYR